MSDGVQTLAIAECSDPGCSRALAVSSLRLEEFPDGNAYVHGDGWVRKAGEWRCPHHPHPPAVITTEGVPYPHYTMDDADLAASANWFRIVDHQTGEEIPIIWGPSTSTRIDVRGYCVEETRDGNGDLLERREGYLGQRYQESQASLRHRRRR